MSYQPVLDMSWGPALIIMGIVAFPFVVVWTLLSESVTLLLLQFHESFGRCLRDVTILNLVSGAVGLLLPNILTSMTYMTWVNGLVGSPPLDNYQTLDDRTLHLAIAILMLADWVGSILLEGFVLIMLRLFIGDDRDPQTKRQANTRAYYSRAFKISTILNTVSYAGLAIAMFFMV